MKKDQANITALEISSTITFSDSNVVKLEGDDTILDLLGRDFKTKVKIPIKGGEENKSRKCK